MNEHTETTTDSKSPTLLPFQERVVAEKRELDRRREALQRFMISAEFSQLPNLEQIRLREQAFHMTEYSDLLGLRIQAFQTQAPPERLRQGIEGIDASIMADKELRRDIDALIQKLKGLAPSRERSLAVTKLQEGVMWLGMDLKRINEQHGVGCNPYPNSKDPSNTVIDPTADGLKF